jgi:hypothetical protein
MEVLAIGKSLQVYYLIHVILRLKINKLRSSVSRVELCQNLAKLGYHVFSIDVRGLIKF